MTPEPLQDADRAFQRIVRMLNASEQSSAKVRQKLARAGYEEPIVEQALARAQNAGIVDDERYADILVRSTLSQGKGFRFVRDELEQLGIALDDVPAYREHTERAIGNAPSDVDRALAFLDAHPPRAKNARDAAFRKLIGRGYDAETAASAARAWAQMQR